MTANRSHAPVVLIALYDYDFGIRSISAFLKSKGIPTSIISFKHHRFNREMFINDCFTAGYPRAERFLDEDIRSLVRLLEEIRPRIVGISLTSVTYRIAVQMTAAIHAACDAFIVWGGIHPTLSPEESITHADAVCVGEGEYPMWELVEQRFAGKPIDTIQNLWVRVSGEVRKNDVRPLIADLDSLPFPDFLEGRNTYLVDRGEVIDDPAVTNIFVQGVYPIMASRGCLFECSFCCNSVFKERFKGKGRYFRRRSVEHVIRELSEAIRNGPFFTVRFWDDVFTFDSEWIASFCREYRRRIGKPFACYAHPQHLQKNVLDALLRAGVAHINIGIQSGSERASVSYHNREQMNKQLLSAAEYLKASRVSVTYDLIVDNPFERDEDTAITVGLLLALPKPYQVFIYSMCFFPKTPMTERALAEKLIEPEDQEQYSSKALNNFYLYIPFVKNKRFYFWDCMIAMACNGFFPRSLVKFLSRIAFLKRVPQIVYPAGRIHLGVIRILRGIVNRYYPKKNFLVNTIPDAALYYYGFADARYLLNNERIGPEAFKRLPVEISLYPESDLLNQRIDCAIRSTLSEPLTAVIFFDLYAARSSYRVVARWKYTRIIHPGSTVFRLFPLYPRLVVETDQKRKELFPEYQKKNSSLDYDTAYLLSATVEIGHGKSRFRQGNRIILYPSSLRSAR